MTKLRGLHYFIYYEKIRIKIQGKSAELFGITSLVEHT